MRLLILLESWGVGGTEQYVDNVYEHLAQSGPGYQIDVACINLGESESTVLSGKKWIHEAHRVFGKGQRHNALNMRTFCQKLQYDWIHLHVYTSTLLCAFATWKLPKTNIACTFHSPITQWHWRYRVQFRLAVMLPHCVIGASEFTASQLRNWRPDAFQISPPISVPEELRNKARLISERFEIVGCGRLSREKDWKTLLVALSILDADTPEWHLTLVGSGPEFESLKTLANQLRIDSRITFAGQTSHSEALKIVAAANLFVLPSIFEGFGMSAAEAMALGVPTITSDFPASKEYIIDGVTGHHFPVGSAQKLAELIRWHLRNPDESSAIGLAGLELIGERYHPYCISELHRELYERRKVD